MDLLFTLVLRLLQRLELLATRLGQGGRLRLCVVRGTEACGNPGRTIFDAVVDVALQAR